MGQVKIENAEIREAVERAQASEEDKKNLIIMGAAFLGLSYNLQEKFVAITEYWDEHPEEHNGPCRCRTCMSYAD